VAVDDLWFKDVDGKKVPSARHGRGKRYRVRVYDTGGNLIGQPLFEKKKGPGGAEEFDASTRADISRGTYIDPKAGRVRLKDYAGDWLAAQTTDPSTRERVASTLATHIYPTLGQHELRVLAQRPSLIQSWLRGLSNSLAKSTVGITFGTLSTVLAAALEDGLINRNPCKVKSVRPPPAAQRKIRPWPVDKVQAIRAGMRDMYAATVDCGWGLGMRQGEVFGLSPDDVDWLKFVVHVRRQVKLLHGRPVFAPPKGGKEREVPLAEPLSFRLAAALEHHPAKPVELPWEKPDGKPVTVPLFFTTPGGNAINRNTFNARTWKPTLIAAKFPAGREDGFHQLRHTYASELLSQGVDIRALAEYMGHTDPGFTLRVYAHLMPRSADRARLAIASALGSPVPQVFRAV
jgi:integrase